MNPTARRITFLSILAAIAFIMQGAVIGGHVYRWEVVLWGSGQILITYAWYVTDKANARYYAANKMLREFIDRVN